jgi:hypothetical protein
VKIAKFVTVTTVFLLFAGAGAAGNAGPHAAAELTWRIEKLAFGCEAKVDTDQPRDGAGSLRLRTQTDDPAAWLTFVQVRMLRRDGQPLGRLDELVEDGSLSVDFFRHPDSGDGLPGYTLPYVTLHVRTGDGKEAALLWESAYNGYPPRDKAVVPEGRWLNDVSIDDGIFWMRYQSRNYNRGAGFRPLDVYAKGHTASHAGLESLKLGPDTQVMAVGVGSGPNLPGLLLAYVDDVRLAFGKDQQYQWNFEPAGPGRDDGGEE